MRALVEDYVARVRRHVDIEVAEMRDSQAALRKLSIDPSATVMLLDAGGKQLTSDQFAAWLGKQRDCGTRELVFLCGDAEGFPAALREPAAAKFSLTSLTLSHELARVVLAEQLYRAFAILSGSPYPK